MALSRDLMLRKRCYYSARSMYTEKPRDIRTEKKGNLSPKVMEILKVRGKLSRNMWNKYKIQFWSDNIFGWNCRQPPCGAVSWNCWKEQLSLIRGSQPPCGAVSWNIRIILQASAIRCQPPCEAASLNYMDENHGMLTGWQKIPRKEFFTWQFPCFSCMIKIVWRDIYRFHANVCNDHSRRTDYGS